MKKIITLILIFITLSPAQDIDTVYLLQTTDVHGKIYPYNYFTDQPDEVGLAKVYTRIKKYREKHKNVLLVDCGDLLQGTPMIYSCSRRILFSTI